MPTTPTTSPLLLKPNKRIASATASTPTVALHQLCKNCTQFLEKWDALRSKQSTIEVDCQSSPTSSFLCTVLQLADAQEHCHFCAFLLATLDRWPFANRQDVTEMKVSLHYCDEGKGVVHLYATFGKEPASNADDGRRFASFALELYDESARGGFHEHFAAREVPLHPADNLSRAKDWINTCLETHEACLKFQTSTSNGLQRPTRVLEITGERELRLRCNMANTNYDYLALSHMWGKDHKDQIRLVGSRLPEFTNNVPWKELSNIYREALHITRALGYRYLWIDSLCIIQDSKDDWEYEARRMATVYGNCVCNIAYLFPPSSTPPTRDDPRVWNPCILRPAAGAIPGLYVRHFVDSWRQAFPDEQQDWLVQRHWPLFSRAWTFQEYLLSPRTILYGHKNLMFQCSELFYDELLGPVASTSDTERERGRDLSKSRYFPKTLLCPVVRLEPQSSSSLALRFLLDWTSLVNEYRTRTLSFPSDRVIAFAGIAAFYQQISSLDCLAGLWWQHMPLCLLWYVERKPAALVRGQYPEFKRGEDVHYTTEVTEQGVENAPSWSWFSVPIWKFWRTSFLFGDDEPAVMSRSEREPDRSSFSYVYWASAVSYTFGGRSGDQHSSGDGSIDMAGLHVTLNTIIWPVKQDLPADLAHQFRIIQSSSRFDERLSWDPRLMYHPDLPTTSRANSPPRNGVFALLIEFQIVRTAGDYNIQRRLAGLVLVPGTQADTWRRVGVWYLKIRIQGINVKSGEVEIIARRWKHYSITSSWRTDTLTMA